jgi:hypothetical protein
MKKNLNITYLLVVRRAQSSTPAAEWVLEYFGDATLAKGSGSPEGCWPLAWTKGLLP